MEGQNQSEEADIPPRISPEAWRRQWVMGSWETSQPRAFWDTRWSHQIGCHSTQGKRIVIITGTPSWASTNKGKTLLLLKGLPVTAHMLGAEGSVPGRSVCNLPLVTPDRGSRMQDTAWKDLCWPEVSVLHGLLRASAIIQMGYFIPRLADQWLFPLVDMSATKMLVITPQQTYLSSGDMEWERMRKRGAAHA